jgi:hypothetical protein
MCGVEVHTLFGTWAQHVSGRGFGRENSVALAVPTELIVLVAAFHCPARQLLSQSVEVHGQLHLPIGIHLFRQTVREQFAYPSYVFVCCHGLSAFKAFCAQSYEKQEKSKRKTHFSLYYSPLCQPLTQINNVSD